MGVMNILFYIFPLHSIIQALNESYVTEETDKETNHFVVNGIINKDFDEKTHSYIVENVCSDAAIFKRRKG